MGPTNSGLLDMLKDNIPEESTGVMAEGAGISKKPVQRKPSYRQQKMMKSIEDMLKNKCLELIEQYKVAFNKEMNKHINSMLDVPGRDAIIKDALEPVLTELDATWRKEVKWQQGRAISAGLNVDLSEWMNLFLKNIMNLNQALKK